MEYRKRKGTNRWHWHKNCQDWPVLQFDKKIVKPTTGELCLECKNKVNDK